MPRADRSPTFIYPDWPAPKNVRALQTTRTGGLSAAPYNSLNIGRHVGDDAVIVLRNRMLLAPHLPSPTRGQCEPVWLTQTHGVKVIDAGLAPCDPEGDACIAKQAGAVCVVMTADCLPILLCDDQGCVVGAAHAGWRGLCAGVIEATVQSMAVPATTVMAWLGPAIGSQSFEVGEEVRAAFMAQDARAAEETQSNGNTTPASEQANLSRSHDSHGDRGDRDRRHPRDRRRRTAVAAVPPSPGPHRVRPDRCAIPAPPSEPVGWFSR